MCIYGNDNATTCHRGILPNDTDLDTEQLLWFSYFGHARNLATVFGVLGGVGSLCIITSSLIWPQLRRATSRHILFWISVCDLGACVINVLSNHKFDGTFADTGCAIEGYLWVVFTLGFVLWSTALSVHFYASLVKPHAIRPRTLLIVAHILCWGIPITMASIAMAKQALGNSRFDPYRAVIGWCWVDAKARYPEHWSCEKTRFLWMMLTLKAWEIASYVVIPILYIQVVRMIQKETSNQPQYATYQPLGQAIRNANIRLAVLPVCYVFLRVWGTVRIILDVLFSSCLIDFSQSAEHFFNYAQAIGDSSQGLVNFILFICFTSTFKQAVRDRFNSLVNTCPSCPSRNGYHPIRCSSPQPTGHSDNGNVHAESSFTDEPVSSASLGYHG